MNLATEVIKQDTKLSQDLYEEFCDSMIAHFKKSAIVRFTTDKLYDMVAVKIKTRFDAFISMFDESLWKLEEDCTRFFQIFELTPKKKEEGLEDDPKIEGISIELGKSTVSKH